jgi:hypothetical protein
MTIDDSTCGWAAGLNFDDCDHFSFLFCFGVKKSYYVEYFSRILPPKNLSHPA